jgi:hypothetical protein
MVHVLLTIVVSLYRRQTETDCPSGTLSSSTICKFGCPSTDNCKCTTYQGGSSACSAAYICGIPHNCLYGDSTTLINCSTLGKSNCGPPGKDSEACQCSHVNFNIACFKKEPICAGVTFADLKCITDLFFGPSNIYLMCLDNLTCAAPSAPAVYSPSPAVYSPTPKPSGASTHQFSAAAVLIGLVMMAAL